jgi:ABC-type nitrate/sulfonate/bicarbonate transport system permease component
MALSTVQSTLWGFLVGVSTGFVAGLVLGRNDRLARIFEPYIVAFDSLPRIALVPLITMIFGFGIAAKIVLAWTIVFLIIQSLGTLNAADVMVALVALGVIGIVMALGIKQVEVRLLRWRPEHRKPA